MSKLYNDYNKTIRAALKKELGLKNVMAVPKITKIVLNSGMGEALMNKSAIESMSKQMELITGQKPLVTIAKKDVSTFKLRKGNPIGIKVTLRKAKMYDFLEKFVKIVLPRLRDFRGVSDSGFDRQGNYSIGFSEQIVFPEIDYNKIDKVRGLEITFVTTAKNKKSAKLLLEKMGMPFVKKE